MKPLYQLFVLGIHDVLDGILDSIVDLVEVRHPFGIGVYDELSLIDEDHLDRLV